MANLTPVAGEDNVPQLELTTLAQGGAGAPMNTQAQALLNRDEKRKNDIATVASNLATHQAASDPHPQYATDADLTAHTSAPDPHPQYATDADLTAHTGATDPHPQYTTDTEVNALIAAYIAANPSAAGATYINSSQTISSGQYNVDTSGGPVSLTLPTSPASGKEIVLNDPFITWGTANVTLINGGGGNTIYGSSSNLVLDVAGATVKLIFKSGNWSVE